ncbi:MAG: hypothetical protein FJ095_15255 [Deltaproteobacteria bacterium]|nr:hypothetical protein [Deltaproteobacteria bacterium]
MRRTGFYAAPVRVTGAPALTAGTPMDFDAAGGARVTTDDPWLKAALVALADAWPRGLDAEGLVEQAAQNLRWSKIVPPEASEPAPIEALLDDVMELVQRRIVELVAWRPSIPSELDYVPRLRAVTRVELDQGPVVTGARHEPGPLDPWLVAVAKPLDGQHGLDACVKHLAERLAAGALDAGPLPEGAEERDVALRGLALTGMTTLRRLGLLEEPRPEEPTVEAGSGTDAGERRSRL